MAKVLYDPTDYNDRLLLGLRGMMNEAELYILKGRMHEGRRNKAKRGDLLNHPPMGMCEVRTVIIISSRMSRRSGWCG